jgi:predicted transcriptional regulator
MLQPAGRRSSIQIIADILRLGEAGKTQIMYAANMSYQQLQKYIAVMLKLRLLDKETTGNRLVVYRATQKGLKLLRNIDTVQEILDGKAPIDPWHQHEVAQAIAQDRSTV